MYPPPRDDVEGRRAFWEPILAASGGALPFPEDVKTTDSYATADDGTQIRMRWYTKDGATPGPAVVYGYAALSWLHDHAAQLGVDPDRIGVMGDSAGAGMAAAVSILARERGGPRIARQILVMPMLDDRTGAPDPHLAPFSYNYGDLVTGWRAYLGDAVGTSDVPPTAAPARLEDATGLPAAYIEVGQLDLFRDEDTAYATKLSRAGVEVEFHLHPGVPHEFDSIAFDSDVARRAVADRIRVLKSI